MEGLSKYVRLTELKKLVAVFLVMVIGAIPLIESFHYHSAGVTASAVQAAGSHFTQYKKFAACKLCDYLKDSNYQQVYHEITCYAVMLPSLEIEKTILIRHARAVFIHCCANKGPPLLLN